MQIPGLPSLLFLLYLLFVLPSMAFRSRQKLNNNREARIDRFSNEELEKIWISTLINLAIMFVLAWAVGNGFCFRIFSLPNLDAKTLLAAILALLLCLLIRLIARRLRPVSERKQLLFFALAPRTRRQWLQKSLAVLFACVAEESAYRGVAWQILSYSTGQHLLAAVICSVAFSLAHWVQGWISILAIFLVAVVMHGLVEYTNSLVPAMLVHGVYDFIAIGLISMEASQYRQHDSLIDVRSGSHE